MIPEGVDVGDYILRNPVEIGFVLRSLVARGSLVSVYFDQGQSSFLTTLLDVDSKVGCFWFDVASSDAVNRVFLRADRAVFVAAPDGVKVQFVLMGGVELSAHSGASAFVAPFPEDLIKLQRREFFRIETPIGKPLICRMPHPSGKMLEFPLHDISIGGIGIWLNGEHAFELGEVYRGCRIDLGTFGQIDVRLELRGKRTVTMRNGSVSTLLGFRFVDLPTHTENVLQRYMAHLERERSQLLRR